VKKSLVSIFLAMLLLIPALPALGDTPELVLPAKGAVLIDGDSGAVLFEQDAHVSLHNASTTKIVTALLILENGDLERSVTVPTDFINAGESSIWLEPGETQTMNDLFYAMLLKSANDAAQMLAYGVSGSEKAFVEKMNEKVAELGLQDTHFANCYGLDNSEHYTSAYDLAMLAREVYAYDFFREVIVTPKYQLPWEIGEYNRVVYNGNDLLGMYEYATGMKNGYTKEAGNCLVSSAEKDGKRLIAVVLHCSDMYNESIKLLEYGFNNFYKHDLCDKAQEIATVTVNNGKKSQVKVMTAEASSILVSKDAYRLPDPVVDLPESIEAPVKEGDVLGTITYSDASGNQTTVDLLAASSVKRHTFSLVWQQAWTRVWDALTVVFA